MDLLNPLIVVAENPTEERKLNRSTPAAELRLRRTRPYIGNDSFGGEMEWEPVDYTRATRTNLVTGLAQSHSFTQRTR